MKYTPKTKDELKTLVMDESIHLGDIDTSNITDMSELFFKGFDIRYKPFFNTRADFSGIEKWNVSNVKNMSYMFFGCSSFNQPLDKWDVSNVEDMKGMFINCYKFNQPLYKWNVINVEDMSMMFQSCHNFNQDLSSWDTSNVKYMNNMFEDAKITWEQAFSSPLKDGNKLRKMR